MHKQKYSLMGLLIIAAIFLSSCNLIPGLGNNSLPSGPAVPNEPVQITGEFSYTNEFVVETYYIEHAIGLMDMTGFVKRDKEWVLPVDGQVLGYMDLDEDEQQCNLPPVAARGSRRRFQ